MLQGSEAKKENIVRPSGFTQPSNSMDVPRAGVAKQKRKKRIIIISAVVLGLILATLGLSRLKPAVPSVDRSTVWIDTVKRGPMVRQVRGIGSLVRAENSTNLIARITLPAEMMLEVRPDQKAAIDTGKGLVKATLAVSTLEAPMKPAPSTLASTVLCPKEPSRTLASKPASTSKK